MGVGTWGGGEIDMVAWHVLAGAEESADRVGVIINRVQSIGLCWWLPWKLVCYQQHYPHSIWESYCLTYSRVVIANEYLHPIIASKAEVVLRLFHCTTLLLSIISSLAEIEYCWCIYPSLQSMVHTGLTVSHIWNLKS